MDSLLPCKRKRETEREEEILPNVLPCEILMFDVLSRVDVKSLIQFRSVSKSWDKLVTDPFFVAIHMNRSLENNSFKVKLMIKDFKNKLYSLDYEEGLNHAVVMEHPMSKYTEVCGSCNGLLCTMLCNDDLCIWNPSTGKCRKVSYIPQKNESKFSFGYNQDIDDYEVVRIYTRVDLEKMKLVTVVDVYSLRWNSWRTIHNPPYIGGENKSGVFVRSSHHWLKNKNTVIIAFDSGREKFSYVPLPEFDTCCTSTNILESGGKLHILRNIDKRISELWVMKVYGVKESWTKLFNNIPSHLSGPLLCLKRNGSILMKGDNLDVILYDTKTKKRSFKHITGVHGVQEATTYVESIVLV